MLQFLMVITLLCSGPALLEPRASHVVEITNNLGFSVTPEHVNVRIYASNSQSKREVETLYAMLAELEKLHVEHFYSPDDASISLAVQVNKEVLVVSLEKINPSTHHSDEYIEKWQLAYSLAWKFLTRSLGEKPLTAP